MPDLMLSDFEVEVLARYLEQLAGTSLQALDSAGPVRNEKPNNEQLESAQKLAARFTCTTCHDVGERKADFHENRSVLATYPAAILAPNLGTTWQRVRPGWLVNAIKHPGKVMPWSGMPDNSSMTDADAELLAWYVMNCAPAPKPAVSMDEVRAIFNASCVACHYGPQPSPPMSANPDGGAGWLAVWNRKPRKLDLFGADNVETFAALSKGSLDDLGRRRAVVVPYAVNSPLLMHVRGEKWPRMPYGRDPLPIDDVRKLESWILSGARGPTREGGIEVSPPIEFEGK
jgi:mono/diheme cytochrome c family protein